MQSLNQLVIDSTDPKSSDYVTSSIVAIAVGPGGEVLWQYASGIGHDEGTPATMDTVFWLGSQSKLFCTVAALQAVEEGLIGLDDDISEILPDLATLEVLDGGKDANGIPTTKRRQNKITLRLLLAHQSGVGYEVSPGIAEWAQAVGLKHSILDSDQKTIKTCPLAFEPGTGWAYGAGIDWAGELVARLRGSTLENIYREKIWEPLGMTKTTFYPTKFQLDIVQPSIRDDAGKISPGALPMPANPSAEMAGHGVWSTASDYGKLLAALLNGGGPILSPESVEEIFTPQGSNNDGLMATVHGLGKRVLGPLIPHGQIVHHGLAGLINTDDFPQRRRAGTSQWGGMTNLTWWIDRKSGIASTIFMQLLPNGDELGVNLAIRFEAAVYAALAG